MNLCRPFWPTFPGEKMQPSGLLRAGQLTGTRSSAWNLVNRFPCDGQAARFPSNGPLGAFGWLIWLSNRLQLRS